MNFMINRFFSSILTTFLYSVLAFTGNLQAQSEAEFTTNSDLNSTVDYQISDTEGTFENIDIPPAPVELFSINFDLSPETAIEVGQVRFGCEYNQYNGLCYIGDTKVFEIKTEMGKLKTIYFLCQAYNGCSYKMSEIIDALESQKSLKFDDITNCVVTKLGAKICILKNKTIYMSRGKFRVPELNFD